MNYSKMQLELTMISAIRKHDRAIKTLERAIQNLDACTQELDDIIEILENEEKEYV